MTRKVSPGLIEALRLARLPKRTPTDDDRPPPPSELPGRKPRRIAGQLELGDAGHEVERERLEDVYDGISTKETIDDAA